MSRNDPVYKPTATFADNGVVSDAVQVSALGMRGLALDIPANWTAADIGFQVSDKETEPAADDATWRTVYRPSSDGTTSEPLKLTGILTTGPAVYQIPADAWMIGSYMWLRLLSRSTADFANTVAQAGGPIAIEVITLG